MKKKKVLFAATVVKTHIMQFHIPYLQMFQQMGWETAVAAKNDYENPADCQIPGCDHYLDVPFARVPWQRDNLRAYRMLKDYIDREQFDLIHCHTPVGAMLTRLAARDARKRGTKVIYTAHGFHFYKGAPLVNWLLYYPAEWLLAPLTDVLITLNQEDYARARKHIHAKQVEYVPGVGVRLDTFRCQGADPAAKRGQLGLGQEDFLLLTVAELIGRKNHITVLKALALLRDRPEFAYFHYLVAGRGQERQALEEAAQELGIAEHVHFLGYRQDVPELYRASDLFVFLPFQEGLPVALMEAMCAGLPIVCSRIRGNTDLIEDGRSGVFTENTPQAAAQAIWELYQNPRKREALGRGAAERVQAFDEGPVHQKMKEIYLRTAGEENGL